MFYACSRSVGSRCHNGAIRHHNVFITLLHGCCCCCCCVTSWWLMELMWADVKGVRKRRKMRSRRRRHVTRMYDTIYKFSYRRDSARQRSLESNNLTIRRRVHAVTSTYDHLTLNVWSTSTSGVTWSNTVPNLSEIEQSAASKLSMIQQIFAVVTSRYDLDLWSLYLERLWYIGCYVFNLCTKVERNRTSRGWVAAI